MIKYRNKCIGTPGCDYSEKKRTVNVDSYLSENLLSRSRYSYGKVAVKDEGCLLL